MESSMTLTNKEIEERILTIRGVQIMLDSDLAAMYQTETKYINRAVKRNPNRFPEDFSFQLSLEEWDNLKFQFGTSNLHGGRRTPPYVFTEQGVAMLSAVLQTPTAIIVSVQIIQAFSQMRKFITGHLGLLQRMDGIERKQMETDKKFERVFKALEDKAKIPAEGVFFDGQIFDAYELVSKIIRSAKKSIILIDNYIDESALVHLSKKSKPVKVRLLTQKINQQLCLDVEKVNEQYGNFELKAFSRSHDRFLIIDEKEVYHLGASLKDLGKKWFAFSKMDNRWIDIILKEIG